MPNKFKIRGWVLIITGIIFHYLISPILATIFFSPPLKSDLMLEAWLVALLPICGDLLITVGIIVCIINYFHKKTIKK